MPVEIEAGDVAVELLQRVADLSLENAQLKAVVKALQAAGEEGEHEDV